MREEEEEEEDGTAADLEARGSGFGLDGEAQSDSSTQSFLQVLLHLCQLQLQVHALLLLLFALLLRLLQPLRQQSVGTFSWTTQRGRSHNKPKIPSGVRVRLTCGGFQSCFHVSPVLLQLAQVAPDLLLPLHQLFLFTLQPPGVRLHAVLPVHALFCICSRNNRSWVSCSGRSIAANLNIRLRTGAVPFERARPVHHVHRALFHLLLWIHLLFPQHPVGRSL